MPIHSRFFIVGAQRSATTFLATLLAEHPQIEMASPLRPEPKFFLVDHVYDRGLAYYESVFFANKPGALLRGEKSTSYMESEKAALRISREFPKAKVIFLLREPVARAISNYKFSVVNGFEKLSVEEAFLREDDRIDKFDSEQVSVSPYAYLHRGLYINHIEVYDRYFHPNQLYFMLHEDFIQSDDSFRKLLVFLGVDINRGANNFAAQINASAQSDPLLSSSMKAYLSEYFDQANERLAERSGLDLCIWNDVF